MRILALTVVLVLVAFAFIGCASAGGYTSTTATQKHTAIAENLSAKLEELATMLDNETASMEEIRRKVESIREVASENEDQAQTVDAILTYLLALNSASRR